MNKRGYYLTNTSLILITLVYKILEWPNYIELWSEVNPLTQVAKSNDVTDIFTEIITINKEIFSLLSVLNTPSVVNYKITVDFWKLIKTISYSKLIRFGKNYNIIDLIISSNSLHSVKIKWISVILRL